MEEGLGPTALEQLSVDFLSGPPPRCCCPSTLRRCLLTLPHTTFLPPSPRPASVFLHLKGALVAPVASRQGSHWTWCGSGSSSQGPAAASRSLLAILQGEGGRAMWRGMSYPLATCSLQNAVVFQAYGAAARFLTAGSSSGCEVGSGRPLLSLSQVFWAGCFSGVVQTAFIVPVDLLKIRMQLQTALRGAPGYVGPLQLLRNILRTERLAGETACCHWRVGAGGREGRWVLAESTHRCGWLCSSRADSQPVQGQQP